MANLHALRDRLRVGWRHTRCLLGLHHWGAEFDTLRAASGRGLLLRWRVCERCGASRLVSVGRRF